MHCQGTCPALVRRAPQRPDKVLWERTRHTRPAHFQRIPLRTPLAPPSVCDGSHPYNSWGWATNRAQNQDQSVSCLCQVRLTSRRGITPTRYGPLARAEDGGRQRIPETMRRRRAKWLASFVRITLCKPYQTVSTASRTRFARSTGSSPIRNLAPTCHRKRCPHGPS